MPDETDILNVDLTSVDTSYPLLAAGVYPFTVAKCEYGKTKDGTGNLVKIQLKLNVAAKDIKGAPVNVGFTINDQISVTPSEKYTTDMITRALKKFREGVVGKAPGPFAPIDQYVGQTVVANISIEEDKNGKYEPRNRVKAYVPKA